MKRKILSSIIILAGLVIIGCSSTQETMYNPGNDEKGWDIKVTKKGTLGDEFVCSINGTNVIDASFPFIGDNFEKTGTYKGKKVKMNGFRNSTSTTDSNGKVTSKDTFQIRVFIDDKLVDKFDF